MTNQNPRTLDRLRWKCRRGMLELDEILNRFLDEHYAQLTPEEVETLNIILDNQDPELLRLVLGYQAAEDPKQVKLLKMLSA